MDELANELQPYLALFRRRLRLRDGWVLGLRTLWIACLAGVLIQIAGRVQPLERLWLWTLAPLVAWALIVLGISLLNPLPPMRVARRADADLGLKERLATALILEGWKAGRLEGWKAGRLEDWKIGRTVKTNQPANQPTSQPANLPPFHPSLITLQREDALVTARAIHPRQAFPLRWLPRPLGLAAILVGMTIALAVVPNPMDAVLAERVAVAQALEEQAEQVEKLREEIENTQELTPERREELLRQLAELAEQLRANPGDREEALADLSKMEEALRQELDPNSDARQAALEGLAAQLQALAGEETGETTDLSDAAEALEELAQQLAEMDAAERESLARSLAGAAARAAQAGDTSLAQALAGLGQAIQSGDTEAADQAAQATAEALARAEGELADQAAIRRTLAELQDGRQAIAQAGQGQALAQGQGQSTGQGQSQGQSQGQGPGSGGGQPGGGGGTQADTLPPGSSTGRADRPQGAGLPGSVGELDQQVYVPWERRQGSGDELFISGQETGQGETEVREQTDPLPGAPSPALVPYYEVYYEYLDTANQTIERSYVPSGLRDYVKEYFSRLEP
jgi:hypothetical protein